MPQRLSSRFFFNSSQKSSWYAASLGYGVPPRGEDAVEGTSDAIALHFLFYV